MFKKHPKDITNLVRSFMRNNGLETPWLQRKLIASWPDIAGSVIAQYTEELFIKNQTLMVKITNPALRADLQMQRTNLIQKLNEQVGAMIITNICFY